MSEIVPPAEPIVARASGSAYFVFSILCALPLGVAVAAPLVGRPWLWEAIAVATAGWVFAIVWLRSFRLEVTSTELRYRSLFGGLRVIALSAIESSEIQIGVNEPRDRFRPLYRLVVTLREPAGAQPLIVNIKVLSMNELRRVLLALGIGPAQTPSANA